MHQYLYPLHYYQFYLLFCGICRSNVSLLIVKPSWVYCSNIHVTFIYVHCHSGCDHIIVYASYKNCIQHFVFHKISKLQLSRGSLLLVLKMANLCVWMHVCVCHICKIKLYVSFIYEDILTKFAENVYFCENTVL